MPRPRFTLRVALAVTAIAAFLAWQGGFVVQRHWARRSGAVFVMAREAPPALSGEPIKLNFIRAFLGDEPVRFVYVEPKGDVEQRVAGLRRLFPEAQVVAGGSLVY
jgi:hypothetical protein